MLLGKQHEKLNVFLPTLQYTEKRKLIILFSTSYLGMNSVVSPWQVISPEKCLFLSHLANKKVSYFKC